jgi:hypothetical protein
MYSALIPAVVEVALAECMLTCAYRPPSDHDPVIVQELHQQFDSSFDVILGVESMLPVLVDLMMSVSPCSTFL